MTKLALLSKYWFYIPIQIISSNVYGISTQNNCCQRLVYTFLGNLLYIFSKDATQVYTAPFALSFFTFKMRRYMIGVHLKLSTNHPRTQLFCGWGRGEISHF